MKSTNKNSIKSGVSGQIRELVLAVFELPNYSPEECEKWPILINISKSKTL